MPRKKKNTGKAFEADIKDLYEYLCQSHPGSIVKLDEVIQGASGPRQFDVTIRYNIANIELLIVIECKDHAGRLGVGFVDALESKMRDVGAAKALLVSPVGFQKGAIEKAKISKNVDILIFGNKADINRSIISSIPIIIECKVVDLFLVLVRVPRELRKDFDIIKSQEYPVSINGIPFGKIIFDSINDNIARVPSIINDGYGWFSENKIELILNLNEYFGSKIYIFNMEDGSFQLRHDVSMGLKYRTNWFFGYAKDFETANHIYDVKKESYFVNIRVDNLKDYLPSIRKFDRYEQIPDNIKSSAIQFGMIDMTRLDQTSVYAAEVPQRGTA